MKALLRARRRGSFETLADVEIVEFHHRGEERPPERDHVRPRPGDRSRCRSWSKENGGGRVRGPGRSGRIPRVSGGVPGEHQVYFATDDEVVTISHRALSRDAVRTGAIRAVLFRRR